MTETSPQDHYHTEYTWIDPNGIERVVYGCHPRRFFIRPELGSQPELDRQAQQASLQASSLYPPEPRDAIYRIHEERMEVKSETTFTVKPTTKLSPAGAAALACAAGIEFTHVNPTTLLVSAANQERLAPMARNRLRQHHVRIGPNSHGLTQADQLTEDARRERKKQLATQAAHLSQVLGIDLGDAQRTLNLVCEMHELPASITPQIFTWRLQNLNAQTGTVRKNRTYMESHIDAEKPAPRPLKERKKLLAKKLREKARK